jgi:hypothetical protein
VLLLGAPGEADGEKLLVAGPSRAAPEDAEAGRAGRGSYRFPERDGLEARGHRTAGRCREEWWVAGGSGWSWGRLRWFVCL